MKNCNDCGEVIEKYCEFPKQRCLECHRKATANDSITAPDFTKVLSQ